jgi:hypothetical protein
MGVRIDEGDLRRLLGKIQGVEKIVEARATANALTTVAREVRNEAIDRTKKDFPGLQASRIRSAIKLYRATPGRLEARIEAERKPTNLIRFGAKETATGVSAALKGGARRIIKGAFIAVGRSSNKLVFRRIGKKRLPIESLPGPSVGGILRKHVDALLKFADRNIRAEIADKVRKVLGGSG